MSVNVNAEVLIKNVEMGITTSNLTNLEILKVPTMQVEVILAWKLFMEPPCLGITTTIVETFLLSLSHFQKRTILYYR